MSVRRGAWSLLRLARLGQVGTFRVRDVLRSEAAARLVARNGSVPFRIHSLLLTDQPVLANLGSATYDLYGAGDRDRNLYTWGAMGQISSMGLGLALARPDLRVVVLDGDGSLLMNLGSLATIARKAPANLVHIVWDDEVYETTGRQATHTRGATDLAGIGAAAGIPKTVTVRDEAAFVAAAQRALGEAGPWLVVVKVAQEKGTARPPRDPLFFKYRFMRAIERRA